MPRTLVQSINTTVDLQCTCNAYAPCKVWRRCLRHLVPGHRHHCLRRTRIVQDTCQRRWWRCFSWSGDCTPHCPHSSPQLSMVALCERVAFSKIGYSEAAIVQPDLAVAG